VADAFGRNVPYWMHFPVDGHVFAVVVALCVVCTLVFSVVPALVASRIDAGSVMKEGGRTGIAPRVGRWTQALLIGELAVTFALLAGAGLLVRSFLTLYVGDQVIDASRVLTTQISLPDGKYKSPDQRSAFYQQLDDRLSRSGLPAASIASTRPFAGGPSQRVAFLERPTVAAEARPTAVVIGIGPRYFDTLELPVLRGRSFSAIDATPGHRAAMVNQRFAELFYPNEDPVGRMIGLSRERNDAATGPWLTIIGVAPTIRQSIASGARPVVYLPLTSDVGSDAAIIVGRLSALSGIAQRLRQEVAAADRDVTLYNVRPLRELLDDSRLQPRLIGTIVAAFASIALLLSIVGLYAFTAYGVQQRTHEIGVRMALGARSGQVLLLFLRRGMRPVAAGLVLGLFGAFAVGQILQGILIRTSSRDPVTLLCILLLLVAVSTAACVIPARKAASLDPLVVLRHD
jgi:putative ABC transport system permease protein